MANLRTIDVDLLRQLLVYDPDTGDLTWNARDDIKNNWNARFAGRKAFTSSSRGYRCGGIFGRIFSAHRVAWAITYGYWAQEIDHINGDRSDNRLSNLRSVNRQENRRNSSRQQNNTSGTNGVCWHKRQQRWVARIKSECRYIHIGSYVSLEDAISARKDAEVRLGFHENHGRG